MARDINSVIVVGRLTRDAELRYTNSGAPILKFSIANNYRRKQGEQWVDEVNFFDVVLFGRQGEAIQRFMLKGKQVGIVGELRHERWTDKDGQNRSRVSITAENVQLFGDKAGGGNGSPAPEPEKQDSAGFEDDIPF